MLKKVLVKILGLCKRHILATIILIAYCGLWGYLVHWFTSGKSNYPYSCGAANAGILIVTLFVSFLTIIIFGVLSLINKGQYRKDYLVFIQVFFLPVILTLLSLLL